jgi:hypothetical protein
LVVSVVEALARGDRTPDGVRYQFIMSDWGRARAPEP